VEQVYFIADKADTANQPLVAQRNYEKLANIIQYVLAADLLFSNFSLYRTQQFAAEKNKDDNLILDLMDLQTNCFQPKLSALFEFNYKNIYQQLPQVL